MELSDKPPIGSKRERVPVGKEQKNSVSLEDALNKLTDIEESVPEVKQEETQESFSPQVSIPEGYFKFEPLSNGLIPTVPKVLHYKDMDIPLALKLADFDYDLLDENIIDFLNTVVYEDYNHADMPHPDRQNAIIYYLAKCTGYVKPEVKGICTECNEVVTLRNVSLADFEPRELDSSYKQPLGYNLKTKDEKSHKVYLKIATGKEEKEAQLYIEKMKERDKTCQTYTFDFQKKLAKLYALALSIVSVDGKTDMTTAEKIQFYEKELDNTSKGYIGKFYIKYDYGLDMSVKQLCTHPKCPSRMNEDGSQKKGGAVDMIVPFQKSFFDSSDVEDKDLDEVLIN